MNLCPTPNAGAVHAWPRPPHAACIAAACVLFTGLVAAQPTAPQALPEVRIVGESQVPRDAKTVGDLAEAVALFERLHDLSPQGELRFRALTRLDKSKADRLHIQVLAPSGPIDVPLDELSRFSFDPAWQALPKDTLVRSKLLDGEVAWRSDVRTPGLRENTRRLGDLRLQCKLDFGARLARHSLVISWRTQPRPTHYAARSLTVPCSPWTS